MDDKARRAAKIMGALASLYPHKTTTQLHYKTPFELLVAAMLSAQSTDRQVNIITRSLFQKYSQPEDFARLEPEELEPLVKGCGLHKTKSRNIINTSRILVEKYNSRVPDNFTDLIELPGVGRKTANVVLSVVFGQATLPVDTHVFRVARRLGLASGNTPLKVEEELLAIIPAAERGALHHRLIEHGRQVCRARNPRCGNCQLKEFCPSFSRGI